MDLTEFLLARIAEDEAAARSVTPLGHNFDMGGKRQDERFSHRRYSQASEDGWPRLADDEAAAAHFARHDPARVLAECEAKRGIVDMHQRWKNWNTCSECGDVPQVQYPCDTLKSVATVYADHPDYDPKWQL